MEGTDPVMNLGSLANASNPTPPFSKLANPILSTVAFLSAAVDPRVAAAAAQAALTEYAKIRDQVPMGLLREHKARFEAAVKMGQNVDPQKFGLDDVIGPKLVNSDKSPAKLTETDQPKETELKESKQMVYSSLCLIN